MPTPTKVIAFDVNRASLLTLQMALPDSAIEVVIGATAASLASQWNPGTVDLLVLSVRRDTRRSLELCRFLVSCGVLAREAIVETDAQKQPPKMFGRQSNRNETARPHSPLLVLVPPSRKSIVADVLKAGAHSCLLLPVNAKDVTSMLANAQLGNQPGRHTLDLERAQTPDRWRDEGGQG